MFSEGIEDPIAVANLVAAHSKCYELLETLCICFPGRISGSEILERALDYLMRYGVEHMPAGSCYSEPVDMVPSWKRGRSEECTVTILPNPSAVPEPFPLTRIYRVLANGLSVGTPATGVSGPLVIVRDWDELKALGDTGSLQGAIVLYDFKTFVDYAQHSQYRGRGAIEAAKHGAVASLLRTIAPNTSTSGIHTGVMFYCEEIPKIPGACLSIEDVDLLRRLSERGHKMNATLNLSCRRDPDVRSRNIICEIKGSEFPDEVVVVGGHTDSWDCSNLSCQGAHDDGQGVCVSIECVRLLQQLHLQPRRTVRAVLFVDEECTQRGGLCYMNEHREECLGGKIVAAIETDMGAGPCVGFGFSGLSSARDQLRKLIQPLKALGASEVDDRWSGNGVDITPMIEEGKVPGILLRHEDKWWQNDYFHYHHSSSDTIDHVDPELLLHNLKVITALVWTLANCDEKLERPDAAAPCV